MSNVFGIVSLILQDDELIGETGIKQKQIHSLSRDQPSLWVSQNWLKLLPKLIT